MAAECLTGRRVARREVLGGRQQRVVTVNDYSRQKPV